MSNNICIHCQNGKENDMGDIIFRDFPVTCTKSIYTPRPYILKRNGRYFLCVDGFRPFRINACPGCARSFEEDLT